MVEALGHILCVIHPLGVPRPAPECDSHFDGGGVTIKCLLSVIRPTHIYINGPKEMVNDDTRTHNTTVELSAAKMCVVCCMIGTKTNYR